MKREKILIYWIMMVSILFSKRKPYLLVYIQLGQKCPLFIEDVPYLLNIYFIYIIFCKKKTTYLLNYLGIYNLQSKKYPNFLNDSSIYNLQSKRKKFSFIEWFCYVWFSAQKTLIYWMTGINNPLSKKKSFPYLLNDFGIYKPWLKSHLFIEWVK